MNTCLALLDLASKHQLDGVARASLWRLAGLGQQPEKLVHRVRLWLALLAAGLFGFGVIFWIAANWDNLGRIGHFVLLQGSLVAMCTAAASLPRARTALGLLAFLSIGALFAYFGQTYQTGADAWQFIALWALLALPLCLGIRSDGVWVGWVLVAEQAIWEWHYAYSGYSWRTDTENTAIHTAAWALTLALAIFLSPPARRMTGAGLWTYRLALTVLALTITTIGTAGLFGESIAHSYWLAVPLLMLVAWMLTKPQLYDVYGLSAAGLGPNVLVVVGLGRGLLRSAGESTGTLFVLGLLAAALLGATARGILLVFKQQNVAEGEQA